MENIIRKKIERVKTKEQLLSELMEYYGVLNSYYYDYLESLINLDSSIISDKVVNMEVNGILSQLAIYREIAKYNIYYGALELLKDIDPQIRGNDQGFEGLCIEKDRTRMFEFLYNINPFNSEIPDGYQKKKIGELNLYNNRLDKEEKRQMIAKTINELECERNWVNPIYVTPNEVSIHGNPLSLENAHNNRLEYLEKKLYDLLSETSLDDEDFKLLELQNKCFNALLKEYHLKESDFVSDCRGGEKSYYRRVSRTPNLVIKSHTFTY